MQCPSCGKTLNGDECFCSACGALVRSSGSGEPAPENGKTPQQNMDLDSIFGDVFGQTHTEYKNEQNSRPAQPPAEEQKPKKARKKKGKFKAILISILAVIVARVAVYGVRELLDAGVDAVEDAVQNRRGQQQQQVEDEPAFEGKGKEINPEEPAPLDALEAVNARYGAQASEEYAALFRDAGIAEVSALPLESGVTEYAFAKTDEDGWVFRYEFACVGDVICTMADTIYIPVQGYSEGEIEELRAVYEELFAPVAALDFCTMTMDSDGNYFTLVIVQEAMDNEANIRALEEAEYLDVLAGEGLLSMEQTAQSLREQGMTEK